MRKRCLILLAFLLTLSALAMIQTGCEAEEIRAHARQTLWTDQKTWTDLQSLVAREYKKGHLTEAQWTQFVEVDRRYRSIHNAAVTSLDEYERVQTAESEQRLLVVLADLSRLILEAQNLVEAWR